MPVIRGATANGKNSVKLDGHRFAFKLAPITNVTFVGS